MSWTPPKQKKLIFNDRTPDRERKKKGREAEQEAWRLSYGEAYTREMKRRRGNSGAQGPLEIYNPRHRRLLMLHGIKQKGRATIDWERARMRWGDPIPQSTASGLAGKIDASSRRMLLAKKIDQSLRDEGIPAESPVIIRVPDQNAIPGMKKFFRRALRIIPITKSMRDWLQLKCQVIYASVSTLARERNASRAARQADWDHHEALTEKQRAGFK